MTEMVKHRVAGYIKKSEIRTKEII